MSTRLAQYWLLWQAALSFTRSFSRHLLLLAAIFVTLVSALIVGATGSTQAWLGWALCIPAGFLLFTWTLAYLPGALKLNSPANAQLVPGMRRRLIELSLLVWLLGIGVLGMGSYLITRTPGPVLWLAAFFTLGLAAMTAGIPVARLIYFPLLGAFILREHLPAWLATVAHGMIASQPGLAVLAALGALAMLAMFPQAGRRHWHMFTHQISGSAFGMPVAERQPGRFAWDGVLLRRAVAQGKQGALLMRALGRSLPATLANALALAAVVTGALIVMGQRGILPLMTGYFAQISWVTISGVLLVFLFQAGMAPAWLARTTGEQALVRLAPAFPADASRFNMLLARAQLRQLLTIWLMATGASLLLGLVSGMSGSALLQQVGVCCMTLPALALALRDHARSNAWPVFAMWALAYGVSSIGPLAGIAGMALLGLPFWPVALVTAFGLSALLVRQRLGLMRTAPIAFPAGRID
ncbi:hypothetical protein [Massilia sp.]|uniref:hypothetical protein n=1 Tax=Massilia sp. TaxID=1882437 RepID=UPI0028A1B84F|nr:hypothetical protein [Massilia sp.]